MATDSSTKARSILDRIGITPVFVGAGFCAMCDTRITSTWCFQDHGSLVELRHLLDIPNAPVTASEYALIEEALAADPKLLG